jgi:hypothetical protein
MSFSKDKITGLSSALTNTLSFPLTALAKFNTDKKIVVAIRHFKDLQQGS